MNANNNNKIANKLLKISRNTKNTIYTNKRNILHGLLYILLLIIIIFIILYIYYKLNDKYDNINFLKFLKGETNNRNILEPELPINNNNNSVINDSDECCPYEEPIDKCEKHKEVFHISNQAYTYDQARCKCSSYGADLATYNQMIEAYNKGADWCSYGWSEGQNAYYPTQKETYDQLQGGSNPDKCGSIGINGGVFLDKTIRFGSNCFGIKPKGKVIKIDNGNDDDNDNSNDDDNMGYCESPENYEASNPLTSDEIMPFNNTNWSSL